MNSCITQKLELLVGQIRQIQIGSEEGRGGGREQLCILRGYSNRNTPAAHLIHKSQFLNKNKIKREIIGTVAHFRVGAGKQKMSLEYFIMPESKELLTELQRQIKRHWSKLEGVLIGQIQDNISIKMTVTVTDYNTIQQESESMLTYGFN